MGLATALWYLKGISFTRKLLLLLLTFDSIGRQPRDRGQEASLWSCGVTVWSLSSSHPTGRWTAQPWAWGQAVLGAGSRSPAPPTIKVGGWEGGRPALAAQKPRGKARVLQSAPPSGAFRCPWRGLVCLLSGQPYVELRGRGYAGKCLALDRCQPTMEHLETSALALMAPPPQHHKGLHWPESAWGRNCSLVPSPSGELGPVPLSAISPSAGVMPTGLRPGFESCLAMCPAV